MDEALLEACSQSEIAKAYQKKNTTLFIMDLVLNKMSDMYDKLPENMPVTKADLRNMSDAIIMCREEVGIVLSHYNIAGGLQSRLYDG